MINEQVTKLKGVGEKTAQQLHALNIYTIEDLLFYFPSRYNIYEMKPLQNFNHGDQVIVVGKVVYPPSLTFFRKRQSRLSFTIAVENIAIRAVIFNRAFAKKHIMPGEIMTLTGKWDARRHQVTVHTYKKGYPAKQSNIQPIYPLNKHMTNNRLKTLIKKAFEQYGQNIEELFPERYLTAYKLPYRYDALKTMHQPENKIALKHARRRFTYEELLIFQLKIQTLRRQKRESMPGYSHQYAADQVNKFINHLPFSLTKAQREALKEILFDMKSPYQMNRLLQGDVGSGKTAVAAICLYAAVTAGKQGAFMVPTEILAEQHYHSLKALFKGFANIVLLTGSITGNQRKEILAAISNEEADIVIGTHALIQDNVDFSNLGFVIVDEQHRFGVRQRRALRQKGLHPDVLFMTATPIPRTLAITSFGDMDISVIDEMPEGRKDIKTYWVKANTFQRVLRFIEKRIQKGEQAYIISPLIEESDQLDIQNAVNLYTELKQFYNDDIKIGLLHGRLRAEEKENVMKQFADNNIHILVSTTVVEVGVNVPNATVMVIYDAERFGLAQLHQLRGRVGRGDKQSYCILIADPKTDVGKERMHIMRQTNNGFKLAEEDLKLRGPGDFFGKKQSGLPEFKVADLVADYRALEIARKDAIEIVKNNLLATDKSFYRLGKRLKEDHSLMETFD